VTVDYYGGFEGVTGGGATDGRTGDGGKRITSFLEVPIGYIPFITNPIFFVKLSYTQHYSKNSMEKYLTPTVPIRSDAEREALRKSLEALSFVLDIPKLIPSKVVASNVTSQFRLLILEEDSGRVEVRRSGRGWGGGEALQLCGLRGVPAV